MVLHLGQQDPIATTDIHPAPGVAHQVDGLGGVAGEDDLLDGGGVDEGGHPLTCRLVGGRRLLADGVDAAMRVGVVAAVVVVHDVDHGRRLLRGGGAVEVDQRLAVDSAAENREVGSHVRGGGGGGLDHCG